MTSPYDLFQSDKELEAGKGVVLEYPGFEILIHRAGGANKKFEKIFTEKFKPHRRKHEQGLLDSETAEQIMIEAYAEGVVIGWKNVKGPDGKDIPFSVQNCVKLFTDLPELFKDVQDQANSFTTFRKIEEETDVKN